ncbi:phenylpropionate dioxygenase-like ring-hydroxylating dioxygenase large terminal subunit [Bradyrhizobium sp. USDA 3240]
MSIFRAKSRIAVYIDYTESCHYFWAFVRSYRLSEQCLTTEPRQGVSGIFREDEVILEAQQRAIDEHADRNRFIWLWMADLALADPDLVPDMHWNDDPAWVADGETVHPKCDYRLVVDNLMDVTHETFVHGASIGNDAIAEAPLDVTHGEKTATVTRWMKGNTPAAVLVETVAKAWSGGPLANHSFRGALSHRRCVPSSVCAI